MRVPHSRYYIVYVEFYLLQDIVFKYPCVVKHFVALCVLAPKQKH